MDLLSGRSADGIRNGHLQVDRQPVHLFVQQKNHVCHHHQIHAHGLQQFHEVHVRLSKYTGNYSKIAAKKFHSFCRKQEPKLYQNVLDFTKRFKQI